MSEKQTTLKEAVSLSGKGLHSGIDVTLTFKPAPADHGYVFVRTDLTEKPTIKALAEHVVETVRGTTLEQNGTRVATIEHVLAALNGMQVDNALIEINGPEAPIMDGSSIKYVEAIKKAGIVDLNEPRNYFEVKEKISYSDEERGVDLMIYPDDHLSINVLIDYNSKVLGNQYAILNNRKEFETEIALSRTFVFFHELEGLKKQNKIKGGDLDNAIVILDRKVDQKEIDRIADLFNKPHIKANSEGVLSNVELHFPNEPARHKLLDLMGDIALVGQPIKGKIVATRPGHKANTEFARIIRQAIKKAKAQKDIPVYDPNVPPVLDVLEIRKRFPHRYPFLLVDKIIHLDEETVIGLKNLTYNELFFQGHFPDEPVMPGVLQIEFMAQVGGMLVLNTVPHPENYGTLFLKIDKVKFKHKVVPGDTLIAKVVMAGPIRHGIITVFAQAFVGNKLVAEGELTAQIYKKYGDEK
ncbi:MAG TPA: bifunctional UDP-3-O-[3-hydroxymyristoyl] N-acetylglucosamine deacetylase/3-hydroxyacyl-ACP dehydratase [Bacteroidetes bacterium]|nr:bifunctional UDP-3-O-[3-hydroxymyristoyl] N-acetylglucosamine deacetylase/3-hydroxyacyl-ACP dehydratase [Bacteroidota bacterium]